MSQEITVLQDRVSVLERQCRALRWVVLSGVTLTVIFIALAQVLAQQQPADVLRVRGLVVEDDAGRARVVLGAPIPGDGRATNQRTGVRINDPAGVERFGLGLFEDGRVVMGFDAPRGKGDDRNRERISIVADQEGGAYIRFLDRRTFVAARMYLADDNQARLDFSDSTQKPPLIRRFGLAGEEVVK